MNRITAAVVSAIHPTPGRLSKDRLEPFQDLPRQRSGGVAMTPVPEELDVGDGRLRVWRFGNIPGLPTLHFAHATGFHGRTYAPLFKQLAPHFNVLAWDMRGHGESRELGDPEGFEGWCRYYADLACLLDAYGPMFLAGHSVGGTTSLLGGSRRADQVLGLLLLDPVLLGLPVRLFLRLASALGVAHRFSLAALAARRRPGFASREAMFHAYHGRGPFRTWPDEWLHAYVDGGVVDAPGGVELACRPAFESSSFGATETRPWAQLQVLGCPAALLCAAAQSTCASSSRLALARRLPRLRTSVLPGSTHFLPMEQPERVVEACRQLAEDAGSSPTGRIRPSNPA
ncbi:MAG: alpha/beta fold hydrolase [Pseudomonadota bacterium]